MKTFSVKFKVRSLELDLIITASDQNEKFKVELITGEPNPIRLERSAYGKWVVINPGLRNLTDQEFISLQQVIDENLKKHNISK
ncbi:hypothetical protein [Pedobacter sp. L105]|uniref:hypothetical protein n=1 Tax=Pedobacter sp. L105 TaxID=1641871 RepID=UPI00131AACCF|nr:hypothetical protein [Pedobacter sp. L105]